MSSTDPDELMDELRERDRATRAYLRMVLEP